MGRAISPCGSPIHHSRLFLVIGPHGRLPSSMRQEAIPPQHRKNGLSVRAPNHLDASSQGLHLTEYSYSVGAATVSASVLAYTVLFMADRSLRHLPASRLRPSRDRTASTLDPIDSTRQKGDAAPPSRNTRLPG
jgi:hypothetical protein